MQNHQILSFIFLLVYLFPFYLMADSYNKTDKYLFKIEGDPYSALICLHGMGGDYELATFIKTQVPTISDTIFSFNFLDHGPQAVDNDPEKTFFGSPEELVPALDALKKVVIEQGFKRVSLYGFSAGGGVIINLLKTLYQQPEAKLLKTINFSPNDRTQILSALQKGVIILDRPLKSINEILAFRGYSKQLDVLAKRYKKNQMEPIQTLTQLDQLSLYFIVHFQDPDEILANRDDQLFIQRLKKANSNGITDVIIGQSAGHQNIYPPLWQLYLQINHQKLD